MSHKHILMSARESNPRPLRLNRHSNHCAERVVCAGEQAKADRIKMPTPLNINLITLH